MQVIDSSELKEIQCEVLQAAQDFCKNNGIKYSLACGTLLGAIRHDGYIPWDDDIDIYMLREDYEKFIHIFPEVYNSHYKLISLERSKKWARAFANLYDDRTVWNEKKSSVEQTIGVNIDIFPVDNVPDDEREWKRYDKVRRFMVYMCTAKHTAFRWKNRSVGRNLVVLFFKLLLFPFSAWRVASWLNSYAQKYRGTNTNKLFENVCGIIQKRPFNKEDFEEVIPHKFEQFQFDIMEGYHDYLTNAFGDYMQLPPEKDRHPHHYFTAYWK